MSDDLINIDIDNDLVERAKIKYGFHARKAAYHKANAAFYRDILIKFGVISPGDPEPIGQFTSGTNDTEEVEQEHKPINGATNKKKVLGKGYTFIDWVEDLLKTDNRPRLTQEIRDEYFKLTGQEIEFKNFSSKLATRADRTNRIKNRRYNELPLNRRYWWGLPSWFTASGDFRQEYKAKIPDLQDKNN